MPAPHRHPHPLHLPEPGRRALLFLLVLAATAAMAVPGTAQEDDDSLSLPESASLEELAAKATPAVVLIDVTTAADTRQGSGFLVDPSGRILTNEHVIRNARSARVKLPSGDEYEEVEILAEDRRRDIAVLQVPGFELPYLELGNSDSVRIGAGLVLIGSPLGLENTVSTGILSGRRQEPEGYQLLQVSAPASQGSSGGPVLSSAGTVIGIAVSQIQGGQNLNFALPINYARGLLSHLGDEPVAVLSPTAREPEETPVRTTEMTNAVNTGLQYDLEDFQGYTVETVTDLEGGRERRRRITYRLIETVGSSEALVERYLESQTTQRTEPFGTLQTLRQERSRVVVRAPTLEPVSARGEVTWWRGGDEVTASHDLRVDDGRVVGIVSDTTGQRRELDRDLPTGIILRDTRELALAVLDADSLVGRSVEWVTFDPWTGDVEHERYDVLDTATVELDGEPQRALRINVATGLDNEMLLVRAQRPRVFLRREGGEATQREEVVDLRIVPDDPEGQERDDGGAP